MKECTLQLKPQKFYILATASGLSKEALVLKHGDSFALFDPFGDIRQEGLGEQGLYYCGTRFLSRLELRFCHVRPFLLSSSTTKDNLMVTVDLTNPDLMLEGEEFLPRGSLHILRQKILYEGVCYEALRLENFSFCRIYLPLSIHFEADFVDIFEVRGVKRKCRGEILPPDLSAQAVVFKYRGLDGRRRKTCILFDPAPVELTKEAALFHVELKPKERQHLFFSVVCLLDEEERTLPFTKAYMALRKERKTLRRQTCHVSTSNEQFNAWLNRSFSDLFMMLTKTPYGLYPYAGIPWFNTVFGRDGLITALECLWLNPDVARGVLRFLAATQARDYDPARDAEPGKILHEMRLGEMAATGEIPFARYYGTIDATPLFVLLAGSYYERTRDLEFIREIWPHLRAAIKWMETDGDLDGDGFLEYQSSTEGLVNKGWKDSHDSVFYEDGKMAKPPIALVEVQAYAYQAYLKGALLARALGKSRLAEKWLTKAAQLREYFGRAFWDEDLQTFILALDGNKRPCRVRSSNAGHALWAEISDEKQAFLVAQTLLAKDSFSGWGVRTISSREALYNPVSYHNGSVWPHDNAIIASGLARYGLKFYLHRLFQGLFEASTYFPYHRLPELFCGFSKRPDAGPTPYPVACNPQAWAAAAVFLMLEACLGLQFTPRGICFCRPLLPRFLRKVHIRNLQVGDASVDLDLVNHENDVTINVLRKPKNVEILVLK